MSADTVVVVGDVGDVHADVESRSRQWDVDAEWFAANPTRACRLRPKAPHEFICDGNSHMVVLRLGSAIHFQATSPALPKALESMPGDDLDVALFVLCRARLQTDERARRKLREAAELVATMYPTPPTAVH